MAHVAHVQPVATFPILLLGLAMAILAGASVRPAVPRVKGCATRRFTLLARRLFRVGGAH